MKFVSLSDHNHLPHAKALLSSLKTHEPQSTLTLLAMTPETTLEGAETLDLQTVIAETMLADAELTDRPWSEVCWLMETVLCQYMLAREESFCYVDADMHFRSPLQPILDNLPPKVSVALTPHHFPRGREAKAETAGRYNFGLALFRRTPKSVEVVDEWVRLAVDRCKWNECGHQRYLDNFGELLGDEFAELPKTVNCGPWSLPRITGSPQMLDGERLVSYHFHECRKLPTGLYRMSGYPIHPETMVSIYEPYVRELLASEG
jgi:hypothetical protein